LKARVVDGSFHKRNVVKRAVGSYISPTDNMNSNSGGWNEEFIHVNGLGGSIGTCIRSLDSVGVVVSDEVQITLDLELMADSRKMP
jgi:hypothetical protein